MIRILLVCALCLSFAAVVAASTDEPYRPVPMMKTIDPDTAKAGDVMTATGTHLDKTAVAGLYMIQGELTIEVKIASQTEESIKFAVPNSVKAGRYQMMILTTGLKPQFLEEPVYFAVQ